MGNLIWQPKNHCISSLKHRSTRSTLSNQWTSAAGPFESAPRQSLYISYLTLYTARVHYSVIISGSDGYACRI